MAKHTPGPYRAEHVKGWGHAPCVTAPGQTQPIAQLIPPTCVYYTHVTRKIRDEEVTTFSAETPEGEARKDEALAQMEATATLFAAAPEMLEALTLVRDGMEASGGWTGDEAVWDAVVAAIAKAGG